MWHDLWLVLRGDLSEAKFRLLIDERNRYAFECQYLKREVVDTRALLSAALGRVIAKLDPYYARREEIDLDPARKAESDAIGNAVIERLKAEAKARRHTTGDE
jgi:hypothetical protein